MTQDALFQTPAGARVGLNLNTLNSTPREKRPPIDEHVAWVAGRIRPRATAEHCRTCRAVIITGVDSIGFRTRLDPQPLTAIGEVLAQLDGRHTFDIIDLVNRFEIRLRLARNIQARPAGKMITAYVGKYDVLAEHLCHSAVLPNTESTHSMPAPPAQYDECPF